MAMPAGAGERERGDEDEDERNQRREESIQRYLSGDRTATSEQHNP